MLGQSWSLSVRSLCCTLSTARKCRRYCSPRMIVTPSSSTPAGCGKVQMYHHACPRDPSPRRLSAALKGIRGGDRVRSLSQPLGKNANSAHVLRLHVPAPDVGTGEELEGLDRRWSENDVFYLPGLIGTGMHYLYCSVVFRRQRRRRVFRVLMFMKRSLWVAYTGINIDIISRAVCR